MNALLEVVFAILKSFLYVLEGIIFFFVPRPKKEVKGQIVLITGAGSGIGKLLALRFAKLGSILVLIDIDDKGNQITAAEVRELGAKCHTVRCDLSKRQDVYEAVDKVKKEVGEVDILVNNAGIVSGKSLLELTDEQIVKTFDVNVLANFWLVRGFLPSMLSRDQGHIVNIVSVAGFIALDRLADYCSSKFAALGFNEALREEIKSCQKFGVKTTCVCPFYINTGMFEGVSIRYPLITPMLEPEYVANKIMEAILTEKHILMMSRIMYFMPIIKSILPVKATDEFMSVLQASKSMQTFTGRSNQKQNVLQE